MHFKSFESVVKKLNVPEHAIVTVELWDVPGENDIDLRKTYYLDVDAVIGWFVCKIAIYRYNTAFFNLDIWMSSGC